MEGNTIPVGEKTTIIVKASGDLFLEGQDAGEIRFQSSEDRIKVQQSNDTLYVETHASMDLMVPRGAAVIVEKVGGSALLQDLTGSLVVQKIGGDLAMQRLAQVRVDKVGGNCMVQAVNGSVAISKVGGDLILREANGVVSIGTIGGNGDLQAGFAGNMDARAGGDLHIYITEGLDGKVSLRAGGNVAIFLPPNVNGSFSIVSNGEHISFDFSRQNQAAHQTMETRRFEFKLGEGGAKVEVLAGGDVRLTDEAVSPRSIVEDLDRREEAWKEARDRRGGSSWSGGFGFDRTSAWADMISRRAQEAARRAEQRAQAAIRRTEDQIRRASERDVRWDDRFSGVGAPTPPPAPVQSTPVSTEERLIILQMLQEGKVNIEQAEKLLAALEGRFE
jgi:hypothetical protein